MAQNQQRKALDAVDFIIERGNSKTAPVTLAVDASFFQCIYDATNWPEVQEGDIIASFEVAPQQGNKFVSVWQDTLPYVKPIRGGVFLNEGEFSISVENPVPAGSKLQITFTRDVRNTPVNTKITLTVA